MIKLKNNKNKINNLKDHRMINKYINLYHINKKNPGNIFWHKNGFILFNIIKNFLRKKNIKYKYNEVISSILINKKTWKKSGHWKNYKKYIFCTEKKDNLCIKPMNCIGHIDIYKQKIRSYKDLPIRLSEFGICHRKEPSGSLHGLMRTRSFTQDDAHIFCTLKQIKKETTKCIKMIYEIYKSFNFKKIDVHLSTKPNKYIGDNNTWNISENILKNILKNKNIPFILKPKEGAFYGPKIEFILKDSSERKWQCGTIQLDFNLSKQLNTNYINKKNKKKPTLIIHRAILGSLERFIGILIEENNGWLPLWLTPIQIVIINITNKHINYSKKILKLIKKKKIRAIGDFKNEKINFKIREYTLQKVPYMIVCGDNEIITNKISLRTSINKKTEKINIKDLIKKIRLKIKLKQH